MTVPRWYMTERRVDYMSACEWNNNRDDINTRLESQYKELEELLKGSRAQMESVEEELAQSVAAKDKLVQLRDQLACLSTWKSTKEGIFSPEAQKLCRDLDAAGCKGDGVAKAIKACAKTFGIKVPRTMLRRTVGQAIKEGGEFRLIQLGRELVMAPGFGETQTQFEGTQEFAQQVSDAYNTSPCSQHDGKTFTVEDYSRKQIFQNMDHASDGKKKLNISREEKAKIVEKDLGRKVMDDMGTNELLDVMLGVTDEEIQQAAGQTPMTPESFKSLTLKVLQRKLGAENLKTLSEDTQSALVDIIFAGCCSHKDLNAFKYGVATMKKAWKKGQGPVLLANKVNAATIHLAGDSNSAAARKAVEESSAGGIKLLELSGALFNHKNDKMGYQERHCMFMQHHKFLLYGLSASAKFPDINCTRYQSHSYGANELMKYTDLYIELVKEICDGKTKAGENHIKANVLKGLGCLKTQCEMGAMALYGNLISWPFLRLARGTDRSKPVNLLDLTDLHCHIAPFCQKIANNPSMVLDASTPISELTINGQDFIDPDLIVELRRRIQTDLPKDDLELMISAMFSGAAEGWIIFTAEFVPGGAFDRIPKEIRDNLFILATNDANEGGLGSWRIFLHANPTRTSRTFSSKARVSRNTTEKFIAKHCSASDHHHVMKKAQRDKAEMTRQKCHTTLLKRNKAHQCLLDALIATWDQILQMKVPELNDQLGRFQELFKDPVLQGLKKTDITKLGKAIKIAAIFAAMACADHLSMDNSGPAALGNDTEFGGIPDAMDMEEDIEVNERMDLS
ncbi:hypothetical protein C8J56DRAFT_881094 [Mycena floridula]|nr:hypothetical protein C8J56DRAFT_881094 [Mycena floridula]